MSAQTIVRLDTKELDRIAAKLGKTRDDICRGAAFAVEGEAKAKIASYPTIDTGAYMNSVYVVTQNEDHFGEAKADVAQLNPDAQTTAHPIPSGNIIAHVGPCVEYAEYVELGTGRMSARPALVPAVETVGRKFGDGTYWRELCK